MSIVLLDLPRTVIGAITDVMDLFHGLMYTGHSIKKKIFIKNE